MPESSSHVVVLLVSIAVRTPTVHRSLPQFDCFVKNSVPEPHISTVYFSHMLNWTVQPRPAVFKRRFWWSVECRFTVVAPAAYSVSSQCLAYPARSPVCPTRYLIGNLPHSVNYLRSQSTTSFALPGQPPPHASRSACILTPDINSAASNEPFLLWTLCPKVRFSEKLVSRVPHSHTEKLHYYGTPKQYFLLRSSRLHRSTL